MKAIRQDVSQVGHIFSLGSPNHQVSLSASRLRGLSSGNRFKGCQGKTPGVYNHPENWLKKQSKMSNKNRFLDIYNIHLPKQVLKFTAEKFSLGQTPSSLYRAVGCL